MLTLGARRPVFKYLKHDEDEEEAGLFYLAAGADPLPKEAGQRLQLCGRRF